MANSKFVSILCSAILVGFGGARSGRPVSASAGDRARLAGPGGGARSVVGGSALVKHQLLVLNRCRKRSPNLCPSDRVVAGLCAVFIRPGRLIRSAIVFKPSTLLTFHRALINRQDGGLLSPIG